MSYNGKPKRNRSVPEVCNKRCAVLILFKERNVKFLATPGVTIVINCSVKYLRLAGSYILGVQGRRLFERAAYFFLNIYI